MGNRKTQHASKVRTLNWLINTNFSYFQMEDTTTDWADTSQTTFITDDVRNVILLANFVIVCCVIGTFGIGANIAIILAFVRQGFKDSINISLLGLAVSDLACSVTMFMTSICHNPLFHRLDLPISPLDVMYVAVAWPHVCFNRITSFITAFITLERCLCIAMPLKVKNIITPFRTKVIIASIFISMISLFSSFYYVNKLEWKYDDSRNRSKLAIAFTHDREIVDSVSFFIHSVFFSSSFLLSVVICTIILVVKMNQKTKWRQEAQATSTNNTTAVKEKKVVKMITLISTIFIVCYTTPTVNFLVMVFYPEFSISGKFENVFHVAWSVAYVLDAVNSSVNIFVYVYMSSKFKLTFIEIFGGFSKKMNAAAQVLFC